MRKYCKECGGEIDSSLKKCVKCGRHYSRPVHFILALLYLVLIASTLFYYHRYWNTLSVLTYYDEIVNEEFEERFGHLHNPETGEPINGWQAYLDALDAQMELEGKTYYGE